MKRRAVTASLALAGMFALAGMGHAGYKPKEHYDGPDGDGAPRVRHHHRGPWRHCCGEGYRYVTAESWYGFKRVVAPVRRAPLGDQVLLPSGSWVYCEYSCIYTLRKDYLDFWDGATSQSSLSPGYFRRDFYFRY